MAMQPIGHFSSGCSEVTARLDAGSQEGKEFTSTSEV